MLLLQSDFDASIAQEFGEQVSSFDFLQVPLFDGPSLWNLLIRFAFNLLVCWIITHFLYYKKSQRRDYYFTYILFSVTIFLLLFLLQGRRMLFAGRQGQNEAGQYSDYSGFHYFRFSLKNDSILS